MSTAKVVAGAGLGIALGAALGFYVLAPNVSGGPVGSVRTLENELAAATAAKEEAQAQEEASAQLLEQLKNAAVRDSLRNERIAIISTPDASPRTRDALSGLFKMSGATVVADIQLTDAILDPAQAERLKTVAVNSLPKGAKLSERNRTPGMHTGQLMGAALSASTSELDRSVAFGALSQGQLVGVNGTAPQSATMALIVAGDATVELTDAAREVETAGTDAVASGNAEAMAEHTEAYGMAFVADLARGLQTQLSGVAVAGEPDSSRGAGVIANLRDDATAKAKISTVNNVDTPAGRILTIRALVAQKQGRATHTGVAE